MSLAMAVAVGACAGPSDKAAVPLPQPKAFAACLTCHKIEAGAHGLGPSLSGLAGRPAGRAEGFAYSAAFQNADFSWDRETMTDYLLDPGVKLPGNKMMFAGLQNRQEAQLVADYVLSLP